MLSYVAQDQDAWAPNIMPIKKLDITSMSGKINAKLSEMY